MSCNWQGNFLESDEFYATLLHFLSILQAPIHVFGFYIILKKTPKSMEKVKFPILLLHLICSWCDCYYSIITTPVLLFPSTAGYAMGILYYIIPSWLLSYIGFVSASLIAMSLILVFENRYNFLVRKDSECQSRKMKRLLHFSINLLFPFMIIYPIFSNHVDVPDFRNILQQEFPCLPEKIIQHPRLYYLNTDSRTVSIWFSLDILFSTTQLFFFFFATIFHLSKTSKSCSSRTSQLQNQFFKAMCIQICLPFVVIVVPGMYFIFIFATGYLNLAFNNLCATFVTSHGAFSTFVMLIVHEPYRSATLQILRIRKSKVAISARTHPIGF